MSDSNADANADVMNALDKIGISPSTRPYSPPLATSTEKPTTPNDMTPNDMTPNDTTPNDPIPIRRPPHFVEIWCVDGCSSSREYEQEDSVTAYLKSHLPKQIFEVQNFHGVFVDVASMDTSAGDENIVGVKDTSLVAPSLTGTSIRDRGSLITQEISLAEQFEDGLLRVSGGESGGRLKTSEE